MKVYRKTAMLQPFSGTAVGFGNTPSEGCFPRNFAKLSNKQLAEAYLEPSWISTMELFAKIKDVWVDSKYHSGFSNKGDISVHKSWIKGTSVKKSGSPLPKKFVLNFLQWKPFKNNLKAFYFILKVLFVYKIFKFLSWLFGHVEKNDLIRKIRLTSKIMTSLPG